MLTQDKGLLLAMADLQHSVFRLVQAHFPEGWKPTLCSKRTLVDLSHAIEDLLIIHNLKGVMFTGFQESAYWKQEVARYKHITPSSYQVCIFAGKPLPDDAVYGAIQVTIPEESPMRQEWFVAVLTPQFSMVFCGLDAQTRVQSEARRLFEVLWTFDEQVVSEVLNVLGDMVHAARPDKAAALDIALKNYPPRPPSSMYVSLITQKFIQHLDHQHEIVLDHVEHLDTLVAARTQQLAAARAQTERIIQQLMSAVVVMDEKGDPILVNDVAHILLEGQWDKDGSDLLKLKRLLLNLALNPNESPASEISLANLTLLVSSGKLMIEPEKYHTVVVLHDLTHIYSIDLMRQQFINRVSHELRTPVTTLKLYAYLMGREIDDIKRVQFLQHLNIDLNRLEQMIEDLLAQRTAPSMVTLHRLPAWSLSESLHTRISLMQWADHVQQHEDLSPDFHIHANIQMLTMIITDILSTAVRRAGNQMPVRLSTAQLEFQQGSWLRIVITDHGTPIPQDDLRSLYEPFMPDGDHRDPNQPGLGLSMALAQKVIMQHSGTLNVVSDADEGTQITIMLPEAVR